RVEERSSNAPPRDANTTTNTRSQAGITVSPKYYNRPPNPVSNRRLRNSLLDCGASRIYYRESPPPKAKFIIAWLSAERLFIDAKLDGRSVRSRFVLYHIYIVRVTI